MKINVFGRTFEGESNPQKIKSIFAEFPATLLFGNRRLIVGGTGPCVRSWNNGKTPRDFVPWTTIYVFTVLFDGTEKNRSFRVLVENG